MWKKCVSSASLCTETIETCMERNALQQDLFDLQKNKWKLFSLTYYSYSFSGPQNPTKPVKMTVDQSTILDIIGANDISIPLEDWVDYLTIDEVFNLVQEALTDLAASKLEVKYDPIYGFPYSLSIDWNPEGHNSEDTSWKMASLDIESFKDLGFKPVVCGKDTKWCPDGSFVSRVPSQNCDFASCPDVTNRGPDLCAFRRPNWCWTQFNPTQGASCTKFEAQNKAKWSTNEVDAFEHCASKNNLCEITIELCMIRFGRQLAQLEEARSKWETSGIKNYHFQFEQKCPTCSLADENEKLVVIGRTGISSVFDLKKRSPVPTSKWSLYKTIPQLFDFVRVLTVQADEVVVDYNKSLGYPSLIEVNYIDDSFDDLSLVISEVVDNGIMAEAEPASLPACPPQIKTCADGSRVQRDPKDNCRFAQCPIKCLDDSLQCADGTLVFRDSSLQCSFSQCPEASAKSEIVSTESHHANVELRPGGDPEVEHICGGRSDTWCWNEDNIDELPSLSPRDMCIAYYNLRSPEWYWKQAWAYKLCIHDEDLCTTTVEQCMQRFYRRS